jgi:hypothetical protein
MMNRTHFMAALLAVSALPGAVPAQAQSAETGSRSSIGASRASRT